MAAVTFPAVLTLDPVDGGRLGLCAPFYPIPAGRTNGTEGWLSLLCQPSNAIAAAPSGATDGGGVVHHSASPVHIDTESEPGAWAEALPYKFPQSVDTYGLEKALEVRRAARPARSAAGKCRRSRQFESDPLIAAVLAPKKRATNEDKRTAMRAKLAKRDGLKCCHCAKPIQIWMPWRHRTYATFEHVIPHFIGGPFKAWNLKLAHADCNHKAAHKFQKIAEKVWLARRK